MQTTKHKLRKSHCALFNVADSTKVITHGFLRSFETSNSFDSAIPLDICNICAIFYGGFIVLHKNASTPMNILFAIFNLQMAVSIKGWELLEIDKQCEYLQYYMNLYDLAYDSIRNAYDFSNIECRLKVKIENEIKLMLSEYDDITKSLKSKDKKDIEQWSE
eukprot:399956_1